MRTGQHRIGAHCALYLASLFLTMWLGAAARGGEPAMTTPRNTISVLLGKYYTDSGERETHDIPVHVIQKTRDDRENMVIVICGDGYTAEQQERFISDAKRLWEGVLGYEPFRRYADRFNVYAVCTESKKQWSSGAVAGDTFFSSYKQGERSLCLASNPLKNHILERCIGPAFIRDYHDAQRQEAFKDPDIIFDDAGNRIEFEPYYYVYDYISAFIVLTNSDLYMGSGFNYFNGGMQFATSSARNAESVSILTHELGHVLFHLGDEYNTGKLTQADENASLNITSVSTPETVKWRQLLGFRYTYTQPYEEGKPSFNSASTCMMSYRTNFCQVCQLQGVKRMSSMLADGQEALYVALPELTLKTGAYETPSDFANVTRQAYWAFITDYANRLLSGSSRSRFQPQSMAGETLRLRTFVQNLSETTPRRIKLRFQLKTETGETVASAEKTFDIPPWADRSKFDISRRGSYAGPENFNSGLTACELLFTMPSGLEETVSYAFQVVDEDSGLLLADDLSETQSYASLRIHYQTEDGMLLPGTVVSELPMPIGASVRWQAPERVNGYWLLTSSADPVVGTHGADVYCTYTAEKQQDAIPALDSDATPEQVAAALAGSADARLLTSISDAATYAAYRAWALTVKTAAGAAAGTAAVKASPQAWLSFALGSPTLLTAPLQPGDLRLTMLAPTPDEAFLLELAVADVVIGGSPSIDTAILCANLAKLLHVEGAPVPAGPFSADSLQSTVNPPQNGRARFIITPPANARQSYFLRVRTE